MSISGPLKIINEGLVLALDAGNSKSYPSTGSTWFDLISGSNNGTLINGAYYTSSQPSYINFDGINDYINFSSSVYPVSGLGFTIEAVGSVDSGSSVPQRFLSKGHYGWTPGYFLGKYPSTDGRIRFVGGIGSATSVSSSAVYCYTSQSYAVGRVCHLSLLSTGTYMYLYVNGVKSNLIKAAGTVGTLENETDLNYSASISGLSIATSAKFSVGNYANSNASILDEYLKGKISLVKIYNRALSYSEILINYNSVKNKYFSNFEEILGLGGNSVTTSGDYRIHTFTTVGTASFYLPWIGSEAVAVEYLIVGGGGGGGMDMGGGGGGGGVLSGTTYFSTPLTATVIVGAGGLGAPAAGTSGQPSSHEYSINAKKGDNSVFDTFTAIGGGYGGSSYYGHTLGGYPGNGGSGGGASGYSNGQIRNGGTGTAGQGNGGGRGGGQYYSGGGGGAGAAGTNSTSQPNGGAGVQNSILGVSYFWGGGGGGSGYSGNGGNGGNGGGGGGAVGTTTGGSGLNAGSVGGGGSTGGNPQTPGGNGGANTGGGGGGGSHYNANNKGGDGGSGIVVIRYRYQLIQ